MYTKTIFLWPKALTEMYIRLNYDIGKINCWYLHDVQSFTNQFFSFGGFSCYITDHPFPVQCYLHLRDHAHSFS